MEFLSPVVRSTPEFLSRFWSVEKEERTFPRLSNSGDLSAIERKVTQGKIKGNENAYVGDFEIIIIIDLPKKWVLGTIL